MVSPQGARLPPCRRAHPGAYPQGSGRRDPGQVRGEGQEVLPALAATAKQGLFLAAVWGARHPRLMPQEPGGYQLTLFEGKLEPVPAEKAFKKSQVLPFKDS